MTGGCLEIEAEREYLFIGDLVESLGVDEGFIEVKGQYLLVGVLEIAL